jgi:hypothetical protein
MIKTIRSGRQNRHEKVAAILKTGQPVSPDAIRDHFKGTNQEGVMYRLSTNIYNIRLDGGQIKIVKKGRKVESYQLLNAHHFNDNGRFIGPLVIGKVELNEPTN